MDISETVKRQKLKFCGDENNKLVDGKENIKFLEGLSKILTVFFWQMISCGGWKKSKDVNTKLINLIN